MTANFRIPINIIQRKFKKAKTKHPADRNKNPIKLLDLTIPKDSSSKQAQYGSRLKKLLQTMDNENLTTVHDKSQHSSSNYANPIVRDLCICKNPISTSHHILVRYNINY